MSIPVRRALGRTRRLARQFPEMWDATDAPNDRTSFGELAAPSGLTELFHEIRKLPGWFTIDDLAHFTLVLRQQSALGLVGDVLEIGSYHGRSTVALAAALRPGERLVVCDAFERDVEDPYPHAPTPEGLIRNVRSVLPELDMDRVEIHSTYSTSLHLPEEPRFRFSHVDGGHGYETALHDIELCSARTVAGGLVVVDDYGHPRFAGVTAAVDDFLEANGETFSVLADLNRIGADGRKVYIQRCR